VPTTQQKCRSLTSGGFWFFVTGMKYVTILGLLALALLSGCETMTLKKTYDQPAYAPHNPSAVRVKVSTSTQMVYVMEGKRPLLITACSVGKPGHSTPMGNFNVTEKIQYKRSGAYGFYVRGNQIVGAEAGERPPGSGWSYVGYPMPYWVGFSPGYGFHEGFVWPVPRTHGCIRMHKNDAGDFYSLVHIGTPINISYSQPEDKTLGAKFVRPDDYKDPDPPASLMVSPKIFSTMKPGELIQGS